MDTLVSMGSAISFIYSVALMIQAAVRPEHLAHLAHNLYFESAAMILALITLGKTLEAYSKGKTTSAIKGLMNLAPKPCMRLLTALKKKFRYPIFKKTTCLSCVRARTLPPTAK